MGNKKDDIERILKKRFGIGLDLNNASAEVKDYIEEAQKFRQSASGLVREIHSTRTNFISELIQNAEDNSYHLNTDPFIRFHITSDIIIVENNEIGFNFSNVDSLCSLGYSTKTNKTYGYIGEKGIGFKSVFKISNNPKIFSNGYYFEFKYDKSNPESIIKPIWIENTPDFIDPSITTIILSIDYKTDETEIFNKIRPILLLFLRNLKQIQIKYENQVDLIK